MKFVLPILIFLLPLVGFSQTPSDSVASDSTKKDTVIFSNIDKRVRVVTTYRPSVSDAYKINSLPQVQDSVDVTPEFQYEIVSTPIETEYNPAPINAASMKGEPLDKLYKSLATVGFGNYLTSLADLKVNTLRSKSHQAGLYIHHYSSQGDVKLDDGEPYNAGYSTNYARFKGVKFAGENNLIADVKIQRDGFRQYGYDTRIDTTFNKENKDLISQRYIMGDARVGIQSQTLDSSKLHFNFFADYGFTQEMNKYMENTVIGKAGVKKFVDQKSGGIDLEGGYYGITGNGLDSAQFGYVSGTPWAGLRVDQMRINAGVTVCNIFGHDEFFAYPKIDLSYYLIDDIMVPYFKIDGNCKLNTYREIITENPFVISGLQVAPTNTKIRFVGGMKGKFGKEMPFNISASYSDVKNQYLYVNEIALTDSVQNLFNVIYDDMQVLNVHGEFGIKKGEKINLLLKGDYWHYTLANEEKAWHMPTMEVGLYAKYNIQNKIIAKADVVYYGERKAKSYVESVESYALGAGVDANFGLEYRYTKILSAFLNFNNLAAQQYTKWNFYPGRRFSVLAGVTYAL